MPFCRGCIEDHIDQPLAGFLVDMAEDAGGDLQEVGVKALSVPLLEDPGKLVVGEAQPPFHQVIGLGDELHHGVLDAVVDHLDEVPRRSGPEVR